MRSNSTLALAHEDDASLTNMPAAAAATPAHMVQLATQIRSLGLAGKKVILFAPIGDAPGSEMLVHQLADSLSILDRANVLLLNLRTVPTVAETMTSPGSGPAARGTSDASWAQRVDFHRGEFNLSLDPVGQKVSRLDGTSGQEADLPTMIERARPLVRYVLIDAPDAMSSAATLIAAACVDAVVPIVQKGYALQRHIAATRKQFELLNVPIAGFIFLD